MSLLPLHAHLLEVQPTLHLRRIVLARCGVPIPSSWHTSSASATRRFATERPSFQERDDEASDGALAVTGAQVYRRTRDEHHRLFRWGIGNKFRMISKNRFMPVYKPHPQESVVRDDYYETENPNVVWEDLNESWEVYWYEHNKLNARPFPVKKFGVERAKVEAIAFYELLQEGGRVHEKTPAERPQPGVFYDYRMQDWVAFFHRGGRPHSRCFSASKYGYDGARSLALAKQNDPVHGVLPAHHGGGTPYPMKTTPFQMSKT